MKETKQKPVVGQTVYRVAISRGEAPRLVPQLVSKVGRLYFTIQNFDRSQWSSEQVSLDTWFTKHEYGGSEYIYASEQEWKESKETADTIDQIRKVFSGYGTPKTNLSQLRRIATILNESNPAAATLENQKVTNE